MCFVVNEVTEIVIFYSTFGSFKQKYFQVVIFTLT